MKLEETYAYLKERYSITHSFSTFKHNAIKKGLEKDKDYLKLIASVLFSMGYYREGVVEIATDIHETYCGELDGLEAHIKALESEKEKAVKFGKEMDMEALGLSQSNAQLHKDIENQRKLIRELRAKKDVTRNKELERKVKQLEKASEEYFTDCVKLTGEKKKLEKELSLAKTYADVLNNSYDDMKRQRDKVEQELSKEREYSSKADGKIDQLERELKKVEEVSDGNYNRYLKAKEEVERYKKSLHESLDHQRNYNENMRKWKRTAVERRKVIDSKRIEVSRLYREGEKLKEKDAFYKASVTQWKKENEKLQDKLNTLKHQTLFETLRTYFKNKKS